MAYTTHGRPYSIERGAIGVIRLLEHLRVALRNPGYDLNVPIPAASVERRTSLLVCATNINAWQVRKPLNQIQMPVKRRLCTSG